MGLEEPILKMAPKSTSEASVQCQAMVYGGVGLLKQTLGPPSAGLADTRLLKHLFSHSAFEACAQLAAILSCVVVL